MKNNPFNQKSKEARKASLKESLMASAIQNISPGYYQTPVVQSDASTQNQLMTVTLDKLRPYDGNPRKTRNPAYDDIKASILARGLDHAPNITQRPGDDFYTVADGGNTRLQILNELFQETQDPRFWAIECIFKPWKGDANDTDAKLNQLIGHLSENDMRGELSFIEKALGIRDVKALYEEKYQEQFSHRKLAEKLAENGYPISNQIIARMEQCLTYLYPHIPNVLFAGLGKHQIEKILTLRKNADESWEKHRLEVEPMGDFDEVWMNTLSSFDEAPDNFAIPTLQDELIGNMNEAFQCQIAYDAFKLDIDIEERRMQRLIAKQPEIAQRAMNSEQRLKAFQEEEALREAKLQEKKLKQWETTHTEAEESMPITKPLAHTVLNEEDSTSNEYISEIDEFGIEEVEHLNEGGEENLDEVIKSHFDGLGMLPGVNSEKARSEEAVENGLDFANCGRQPVANIWKVYPNRQHKMEAYSLALDIAEEVGLEHLVEHVVKEPVDYSFRVQPLTEGSAFHRTIHQLLTALSTDKTEVISIDLNSLDLLGSQAQAPMISDLLLVRLFRLIRLVRYIHGGK